MSVLSPKSYIATDYPSEYEKINNCRYAVRIGTPDDGYVEVLFNNDEWVPCRFNSGYWRFNWTDFNPGEHNVVTRLIAP
ncbi:MAG: hypothetical protein LE168_05550 [Endomicrobium sp.]|nr:hypothetical protein [Endomicrobium sp.]